jgi:3,4-dihydroxy 2-butanone 4-phosphate synthase/GTP cyclohydrolase II
MTGDAAPAFPAVQRALQALAEGRPVVVADSESRENEGDLVFAAESATPDLVAFAVRHTSGYLCVALPAEECDRLALPLMHVGSEDSFGTAFTVTVDAKDIASTGISAADRALTMRCLAAPGTTAADLTRPGHVVPLRARAGGVLRRPGHTEAAVDLVRLAGLRPAGVLCELVSQEQPGQMARADELLRFSAEHDLVLVTIEELIRYRRLHEPRMHPTSHARLATAHGELYLSTFVSDDGVEHFALTNGGPSGRWGDGDPVVSLHLACPGGDILGSVACGCRRTLDAALEAASSLRNGLVIYLRPAAGPPATVDGSRGASARHQVPSEADLDAAAELLASLGARSIRLSDDIDPAWTGLDARGVSVSSTATKLVRGLPSAFTRAG